MIKAIIFDNAGVIVTEHKVIKSDPEIYKLTLKMLGVKPQEAVFIDDREINIQGAEKLGITGILFKNPQDLKAKLKQLNITI